MGPSGVFQLYWGEGAVLAAAIHDGHGIRPELHQFLRLDGSTRLREEDPYTGLLTDIVPSRIIGLRSRFEVDLNRPRDKAVYRRPEDAWGLEVWRAPLPPAAVDFSLEMYDQFYRILRSVLDAKLQQYRRIVVLDIHSYNHRRDGPAATPACPEENPEINIGTGTMDRAFAAPLIDRFLSELRASTIGGRSPDVRENVKFQGGYFSRWIHENYPGRGIALAIEFKKTFMDEWTGECDLRRLSEIREALASTLPGLEQELDRL